MAQISAVFLQTNLCKLKTDFAQPIGGCVRALKDNMGSTDPEVALRVAEWLALHINNHDFIWGWQRWENVLELPPYDPVRYAVFRVYGLGVFVLVCHYFSTAAMLVDQLLVSCPCPCQVLAQCCWCLGSTCLCLRSVTCL